MVVAAVLLWTLALSCYDLRQRRLPNWLTLPGATIVLGVALATGRGVPAMSGAAVLAGVYLLVHLAAPAEMGAGDVKLALGLGALTGCFGPDVWLLAALGAPMLTALAGLIAWLGWSAKAVPHGPSMCLASAAAVGLGQL
jgi:leader peptidase (prepilin peptidase) / N-methyltransferase